MFIQASQITKIYKHTLTKNKTKYDMVLGLKELVIKRQVNLYLAVKTSEKLCADWYALEETF